MLTYKIQNQKKKENYKIKKRKENYRIEKKRNSSIPTIKSHGTVDLRYTRPDYMLALRIAQLVPRHGLKISFKRI